MGKFIISYLGKKILNDRMGGGQKLSSRTVPGSIMGEKKLSSFLGQETKMISPPLTNKQNIHPTVPSVNDIRPLG